MYRFLLIACLFLTTTLSAQQTRARVQLVDGTSLQGDVVQAEEDELILHTGGRDVVIPMATVRSLKLYEVQESKPVSTPATPATPAAATPTAATPQQPLEDPDALDQMLHPSQPLGNLSANYLWAVPEGRGAQLSLLAVVWMLLSLAIHFSSSVIGGLQDVSLARAVLLATILIAIAGINFSLPPMSELQLTMVLGLDLLAWMLLTMLVYRGGVGHSLTILLCMVVFGFMSMLLLEVGSYLAERSQGQSIS